jgi:two-component system cell cycle sensor histidine kinase PleC
VNVMQPVARDVSRAARLAAAGADGAVWIVAAETEAILVRSGAATALAPNAARLDDVFAPSSVAAMQGIARQLAPGQKRTLEVDLASGGQNRTAMVLCRKLPGEREAPSDGHVAAPLLWLEYLADRPATRAKATGIEFPTALAPMPSTRASDNTGAARPGARDQRPPRLAPTAIDPADRATLDDIARKITNGYRPVTPSRSPETPQSNVPVTGERERAIDLNVLAHELRTPIGAIVTLAEMLRPKVAGDAAHYLDDVAMCARHALDVLTATVSSAGDTAPLGTTALPVSYVETDLAGLAGEVAKALTPQAREKSIRVACYAAVDLTPVSTDPRAIRQILFNLITNAIKYTPHGGEVIVTVERNADRQPALIVRDTGRGMTRDDIARATHAPDGSNAGPTRHGLRVVKALADTLGASLTIDSKENVGTRVSVTLQPDQTTNAD